MSFVYISYGVSAIAYLALIAILLLGRKTSWPFNYLMILAGLFAVWSGLMIWGAQSPTSIEKLILLDTPHTFGTLLFLGAIIRRRVSAPWLRMFGTSLPIVVLMFAALLFVFTYSSDREVGVLAFYTVIGLSLIGLLAIEQIYRNAQPQQRTAVGLLAVAFGVVLAFDFFVYTNGMLFGQLNTQLWAARGFVNALAVPVLVIALKKESNWESGLFVSRQVVFYTASLVGVGAYLMIMAFGSVLIERFGGVWVNALQAVFLVASLMMLLLILFSQQLRRRVRVFITTHFYHNRYDYREEWLNLIRRLASEPAKASMPGQCLRALGDIIDSDGGALWMRTSKSKDFALAAGYGEFAADEMLPSNNPIAVFLKRRSWVIDGLQYVRDPESYAHAFGQVEEGMSMSERIYVPIVLEDELRGIAALARPSGLPLMNFEDHDLLRTVGSQLAVFLARDEARDLLEETREFEIFNRFTAYIMHDLKNLIAQQSLVVANAEKHKGNPEFVDDAISTIANSVKRMQRLLDQLQGGSIKERVSVTRLNDLLPEIVSDAGMRVPIPTLLLPEEPISVMADSDRLLNVIGHIVRNAQEATPVEGSVSIRLTRREGGPHESCALVEIRDNGSGMDEVFIRDSLFKPFISTKGIQGMGIGVYQARDYVEAIGGELQVESTMGVGTTFSIIIPEFAPKREVP